MATFPWADVSVDWPGYELGADTDVTRTELADGAVRQARTAERVFDIRRVEIAVQETKLFAVRDWFRDHAGEFFEWRDLDGDDRQVRVRGGFGAISFSAVPGRLKLHGERFYRAALELEGYW